MRASRLRTGRLLGICGNPAPKIEVPGEIGNLWARLEIELAVERVQGPRRLRAAVSERRHLGGTDEQPQRNHGNDRLWPEAVQ